MAKAALLKIADADDDVANEVLVALQRVLTGAAIGAARTASRLGAVAHRHETIEGSARALKEVSARMRAEIELAAEAATQTATASEQVADIARDGRRLSAQSMGSMTQLLTHSDSTNDRLRSLLLRVREVAGVSRVIDEIASRARLLALNASIEATRAGSAGAAFGVVAGEVRELAKGTADKTKKIDELMRAILADLEPVRSAMEESRDLVQKTAGTVGAVDQRLAQVNDLAGSASTHVREIAQAMRGQSASMSTLAQATDEVVVAIRGLRDESAHIAAASLSVASATSEGQAHLVRVEMDTMFHRGLKRCRELAGRLGDALDQAVDTRLCTVTDALALEYTEIVAADIRSLSHLFNVTKVPASGFSPPKFHTPYDRAVDVPMQAACDFALRDEPKLLFAFPIDLNAYCPSHNKKFTKDWTGIAANDLAGNRIKRFFNETNVVSRAARLGLGSAAMALPNKARRPDFERVAHNLLDSRQEREEFLVQTYVRDTGEFVTVISVPVFVKGKRWGAGIVGWTVDAD